MKERIQKIISASGLASRRAGERMISEGLVKINGVTASVGDSADPETDVIEVGGKRISAQGRKTYIMLNKPRGYITSLSDEKGRPCVAELVSSVGKRVYPVGRLDMYSEGLLIMTDDGDFANRLMHPSGEKCKTYRLTISGECSDRALSVMRSPLLIGGYRIRPAEVVVVKSDKNTTLLDVTIHEGRNRQIRKMCEQAGLKLTRLVRISESGLELSDLPVGKWRYLTEAEVEMLK